MNNTRRIEWLIAIGFIAALAGLVTGRAAAAAGGTLVGKIMSGSPKDSVVYLDGIQGSYPPPSKPAVIDQKNKTFIPELLALQTGQTLRFENHDGFSHNAHIFWSGRSMFNESQPPNGHSDWVAHRSGEYIILCNTHQEMAAAFLVLDHPFFAQIAAGSSDFTIKDIPVGTYTLVAVQYVKGNFKKKKTKVTIKEGETTNATFQF